MELKKKETIAESIANGIYDALYDKENRTPIDASAIAFSCFNGDSLQISGPYKVQ